MKIGLFFGTFNPIHTGHLILAQTALNETFLEYVWFLVSPQNPFKQKKNLLSEYDRLRMVELAIEDHDQLRASNVEFTLPKPSYTIDTLTHLRERYPSYEFSIIMGEDNLQHFHKWKNYEAILKYYPIYIYPRGGAGAALPQVAEHPHIRRFEAPLLQLSATYLRACIRAGKSVRYMLPEPVREYIEIRGLYK
ncbi:MAG: nicotinate-nucleotide adenylyltransferase [Bacteroidetes bacterium]|nr:MAG: nicotinate-nucleotide adenylyltransferase [Bacteroidota bacterium]